jgi:hypothetical protein
MDWTTAVESCLEFTNPKLESTLLLHDNKLSYHKGGATPTIYPWEANRAKELAVHGAP